jgi:hypothetical protein
MTVINASSSTHESSTPTQYHQRLNTMSSTHHSHQLSHQHINTFQSCSASTQSSTLQHNVINTSTQESSTPTQCHPHQLFSTFTNLLLGVEFQLKCNNVILEGESSSSGTAASLQTHLCGGGGGGGAQTQAH